MYIIYSKPNCSYCAKAKQLLTSKKLPFKELVLGVDYTVEQLRELIPGVRTVPQIFCDGKLIGGFDALKLNVAS